MRHLLTDGRSIAATLAVIALVSSACGFIGYAARPAAGYETGSETPLRIAVSDETADGRWSTAIDGAITSWSDATPRLAFQRDVEGANIVMRFYDYSDDAPPVVAGYVFPPGAGAFAAVRDARGVACNFPPSPLPESCDGEIAGADIYFNAAAAGATPDDRSALARHEIGHALGLTRHSADIDAASLYARYGWRD